MDTATVNGLKRAVYDRFGECRAALGGGTVDMSSVQESVRSYCDALAALPRNVLEAHKADLEEMMRQLGELSDVLVAERDAIRVQIDGLGKLRQANIAYQTSGSIGGVKRGRKENN